MNVAVVAPQTSRWRDADRAGALLVRALNRSAKAWLITSIYHEGEPAADEEVLERSLGGYVALKEDPSGVPTIRVLSQRSLSGGISLRSFPSILRNIDDVLGFDVVVVLSSFWNGPEEVARWAEVRRSLVALGEARGVAVVYIPLYLPPPPSARSLLGASKLMWCALHCPRAIRAADLVVAMSEEEAEELSQYRPRKIAVAPNWIDEELLARASRPPPGELEGAEAVVAYVGPLEEDKNLELLVKTAERLSSAGNIVVAAVGAGGEAQRLKRARPKNLLVLEDVEPEPVMAKSALGVDLSSYEPAGIRVLEFMGLGVPVAVSQYNHASRLVRDGVDGVRLAQLGDAPRVIESLVRRLDVLAEMGAKAKERAPQLSIGRLVELILGAQP